MVNLEIYTGIQKGGLKNMSDKIEEQIKDNFGIVEDVRLTFDLVCVKCKKPFTESYLCRRCRKCFDFTIMDSGCKPIIRKFTKEIWYDLHVR